MAGYADLGSDIVINPEVVMNALRMYVGETNRGYGCDIPVPEKLMFLYDTCVLACDTENVLREIDFFKDRYFMGTVPEVIGEIKGFRENGWRTRDGKYVPLSEEKLGKLSPVLKNVVNGNGKSHENVKKFDKDRKLSRIDRMLISPNPEELRIAITRDEDMIRVANGMNKSGVINTAAGYNHEHAFHSFIHTLDLKRDIDPASMRYLNYKYG